MTTKDPHATHWTGLNHNTSHGDSHVILATQVDCYFLSGSCLEVILWGSKQKNPKVLTEPLLWETKKVLLVGNYQIWGPECITAHTVERT